MPDAGHGQVEQHQVDSLRQRHHDGRRGVRVRWSDPGPVTAQVLEVGWDADRGGSDGAVLGALNALLVWPLLR